MIPAPLIEPLSIAIGRLFPPADLDLVMLKTTGDGLFQWVPRGLNDRETAHALLAVVSERDMELIVLAEFAARTPPDNGLIPLIDEACPGARQKLPTTREHVQQLITGIDDMRARLNEPAVRQAVDSSKAKLQEIVRTIDSLKVYKNLHECLHQLQVKQFQALRAAARKMPENREQALVLRDYRDQLRGACVAARGTAQELNDPPRRQTEMSWIDDLEQAGDRFHAAIATRNARAAQTALKDIRFVMRAAPPRLNDLIAAIAKVLPLDELEKALGSIAQAGGGDTVANALHALRLIIPTIRARVNEHRSWQAVDIRISDLDRLIEQQPRDLVEEFASDWLEVKSRVHALAVLDPGSDWTQRIDGYAGEVSDRLAQETVDEAFEDAFADFRGDAQYRFLTVDSKLKYDCGELVKIGVPLRDMLAEID
ncbi:hypothetical protein AB3G45_02490 [Shinella sp. S4-D37]|uniref:hypothetical protein n=1 Tax=Shinella sp. S4-D37 TaxID=3161999 RepID=UPI0034675D1F